MSMLYKIYNPSSKEYSSGGGANDFRGWSKNGKVWATIHNLKAHLRLHRDYTGCQFICFEPVLSVEMKDVDNIELLKLQKQLHFTEKSNV